MSPQMRRVWKARKSTIDSVCCCSPSSAPRRLPTRVGGIFLIYLGHVVCINHPRSSLYPGLVTTQWSASLSHVYTF
jgi:hypothetical protein